MDRKSLPDDESTRPEHLLPLAQLHNTVASHGTSVGDTDSRDVSRSSDGGLHVQQSSEPTAESSGKQQHEPTSQHLGPKLQKPEPALPQSEYTTLHALTPDDSKRNSADSKGSKSRSAYDGSTSLDSGPEDLQSNNCEDKDSEDEIGDDQRSYASTSGAQGPFSHRTWLEMPDERGYRHLVTGAVYCNDNGNPPKDPGPTAENIPDCWKAYLPHESEEYWNYVHLPTGVILDKLPTSLPEAVMEDLVSTMT